MEEQVVIETRLGKLRGQSRQSIFNKGYYSFQGIPFGKPPVGELRFKAPQPFGGWEGIRDALDDGPMSKQPVMFRNIAEVVEDNRVADGSEDCLYLNVYISELPDKASSKKPVMVSIHGGGFMGGSGNFNTTSPDYLLEGDVVLVFFNYRCGPFGFLSLDSEEVPGNAGLKDQTLALKWVRDNIDSFGGDPNNVTIFGISGGGASVHYQLLSPLSQGFFHKAIIQSGFSQNLWAFQPTPRKVALKLAKRLGCTSEDSGEVFRYLQNVPGDDIIVAHNEIIKEKEYVKCCSFVFSPSVEVAGTEKFLPDSPNNLMRRGEFSKVPTILGICQNEGVLQLTFLLMSGLKVEDIYAIINNNPELLVPHFLGLTPGSTEEKEAQEEIWNFYLRGKPLSKDNLHDYIDYHGDLQFNLGFAETRRYLLVNSNAPTFSYFFTDHTKCVCKNITAMMPENVQSSLVIREEETCHGADVMLYYGFGAGNLAELTPQHKEAIIRHVKTWATFASTGDPNNELVAVRWDQDSEASPCYMDMGIDWTMREGELFAERMAFWKQLADRYCVD